MAKPHTDPLAGSGDAAGGDAGPALGIITGYETHDGESMFRFRCPDCCEEYTIREDGEAQCPCGTWRCTIRIERE